MSEQVQSTLLMLKSSNHQVTGAAQAHFNYNVAHSNKAATFLEVHQVWEKVVSKRIFVGKVLFDCFQVMNFSPS